jgi:glycosidase
MSWRQSVFGCTTTLLAALAPGLASGVAATTPPATHHATAIGAAPSNVWYEIFVRSWFDTDGDGIGDLDGVTAKLDYLQSLGVSGIWLMPINPSPSNHGYDVTDYYGINPQYDTMQDFEELLAAAHKRGIKVIMDLVINHSSDQHPWFRAALDPASKYRHWYQWSSPDTDLDAISATGTPAWHARGKQHYLGVFTGAMPDLDFDNPAVRQEMIRIGRYWLEKGVDGFRLDAAQHVYLDYKADVDNPQVLAKNIAWWGQFRAGMNAVNPHAYIVGEVTQPTPEKLAPYFKPLSAVFDFPLAEKLIDSARRERNDGLDQLLGHIDRSYRAVTGRPGVDAPFLSNHDQNRVMSQLDGNVDHMRMAAALLLTLPGDPFVYYGEEIGMRGQKPDPDIRTPMRWNRATNAPGETTWRAGHNAPATSVEAQRGDPDSLLSFYTTLIHWRSQVSALRDGQLTPYSVDNKQVVAYRLDDADSHVLVVHNLSGEPQTVTPDRTRTVRMQSKPDVALHDGLLHLPAYGTAVLQ